MGVLLSIMEKPRIVEFGVGCLVPNVGGSQNILVSVRGATEDFEHLRGGCQIVFLI